MKTRNSQRMLLTLLLSGATLAVTAGAAIAEGVDTIQGRSSDQAAPGETVDTSTPADPSSADGRSSESVKTASEPRYDLTFTLMQGVRTDEKPPVDAWPGRAAAPADEDATWKVTSHKESGGSRG